MIFSPSVIMSILLRGWNHIEKQPNSRSVEAELYRIVMSFLKFDKHKDDFDDLYDSIRVGVYPQNLTDLTFDVALTCAIKYKQYHLIPRLIYKNHKRLADPMFEAGVLGDIIIVQLLLSHVGDNCPDIEPKYARKIELLEQSILGAISVDNLPFINDLLTLQSEINKKYLSNISSFQRKKLAIHHKRECQLDFTLFITYSIRYRNLRLVKFFLLFVQKNKDICYDMSIREHFDEGFLYLHKNIVEGYNYYKQKLICAMGNNYPLAIKMIYEKLLPLTTSENMIQILKSNRSTDQKINDLVQNYIVELEFDTNDELRRDASKGHSELVSYIKQM